MLPWAEMLRWAMRGGLMPAQFWQLSVKEWHWLTAATGDQLDQISFQSLMEQYPDGRI
ncbi:MAG: phage tail assembly chaperone [Pseudomonadota bacterium]